MLRGIGACLDLVKVFSYRVVLHRQYPRDPAAVVSILGWSRIPPTKALYSSAVVYTIKFLFWNEVYAVTSMGLVEICMRTAFRLIVQSVCSRCVGALMAESGQRVGVGCCVRPLR